MNANELVRRLIEDGPDDIVPKDELLRLSDWRERVVRHEEYEFLSDRWGEELESGSAAAHSAYQAAAPEERVVIERLQMCLGEYENNFIVQRIADKCYGVLFEDEFTSPESEETAQDAAITGISYPYTADEVLRDLWHVMSKLEQRFPQAQFSISVGKHVVNGRFVLRAFVSEDVLTPNLGSQLSAVFAAL